MIPGAVYAKPSPVRPKAIYFFHNIFELASKLVDEMCCRELTQVIK